MNGNKILIVDDDPNIREVLSVLLGSEGYVVVEAEDGVNAVDMVLSDKQIDLVIMDVMMPGIDGVKACQQIRKTSRVPIMFLTAKSQEQDKVDAYTQGGDDYLIKPFSQTELLMKVKSLLRRYKEYQGTSTPKNSTTIGGSVVIHARTRSAVKEGTFIPLTEKEFSILKFFVEHKGEIVSNKDIYEGVWKGDYLPSDANTVMVHILNLRKKLEDDINHPQLIKTIWGKGYKVD